MDISNITWELFNLIREDKSIFYEHLEHIQLLIKELYNNYYITCLQLIMIVRKGDKSRCIIFMNRLLWIYIYTDNVMS